MRDLLGKSIENASEHHTVINMRVGVVENLANIDGKIDQGLDNSQHLMSNINEVQEFPLSTMKDTILKLADQNETMQEHNEQSRLLSIAKTS